MAGFGAGHVRLACKMAEIRFGASGAGDRLESLLEVALRLNSGGQKTTNGRRRILLSGRNRCGEECGEQKDSGNEAEQISVDRRRHQRCDSNSFGGDGCVERVETGDETRDFLTG